MAERKKSMPSESDAQHRAMGAAAGGNSKLGIPEKVGKDFVKADKKAGKKFSASKEKSKVAALRKHVPKKPEMEEEAEEGNEY